MHRNMRFKKITTKRTKTSPSVAAATLAQDFKVNNFYFFNLYRFHSILTQPFQDTSAAMGTSSVTFTVLTIIPSTLCYICTYETFIVVSANWQIGKDQKYQDNYRCPQSSQVKRKGPKSTKSKGKRQKTAAPSPPPPGSPIHVESSPSSPEAQTQQAPSPPQPQEAPQPEETSADVHEQAADPVGSIIASVVSSI